MQKRHTMEHRKSEVPIDTIEQRLERLERESRCWKVMTTLALGTLSLILLIGAGKSGETSVPDEVQAHAFVLVDRNGTPLARLGLLPHGAWGLAPIFAVRNRLTFLVVRLNVFQGIGTFLVRWFSPR